MKKKIWTTKDGAEIEISEMSTQHIQNAISLMRRKGFVSNREWNEMFLGAETLNGEMALLQWENEFINMLEEKEPNSILDYLIEELDKRKAND